MMSILRGMRQRASTRTPAIGAVVIILLALAVGAGAEHGNGDGKPVVEPGITSYRLTANLSGNLVIAGSDTMQPLIARMASEFRRWNQDMKIAVQGGGTEKALQQFLSNQATIRRGDAFYSGHQVSGSVQLLASSRSLTQEEIKDFKSRYGYEPTEIPIALDAIAIYVNAANPIQGLTMEQVDAMFGKDRKRGLHEDMTIWGQVGLEGWEQKPIHLYGRDKQSGTRTFFKNVALLNGELKADVREEPGSASEILAISRDPLGIGYAGIGFQASTVRVVPLAEKTGMPYLKPTADSVINGTYPLGRSLYLYVKKDPEAPLPPHILEFLKFINSREGQTAVAKAGAYPLPTPQVAKNLQLLTGSPLAAGLGTVSSN